MDFDKHPRFRESIETLREYRRAAPPILSIGSSAACVLPAPPRPAAVQRAMGLLTPAETDELNRLVQRFESNRHRLSALRSKLHAPPVIGNDDGHHDLESGQQQEDHGNAATISSLRQQSATRCHVEMLQSVWKMFVMQLEDGRINDFRDTRALQDAMDLVGVRPT